MKKIIFFVFFIIVLAIVFKVRDRIIAPALDEQTENSIDNTDHNIDIPVESRAQMEGNVDDLIYFSILPGTKLPDGVVPFNGAIKGAYFFEANIHINLLDADKNILKRGYATALTDWMTGDQVDFSGELDTTGLTGVGYIQIQNDDPSDGEGGPPRIILIPIIFQ